MGLDVVVPKSPDLSNRGMPRDFDLQEETLGSEDFYREDLEELLEEGAWREGFEEWTEYTDLAEGEFRILDRLELFRAFDFYWDPVESRLRYDAPTIPDDWCDRDATASLDSVTVSKLDVALDDLSRAVSETLEDYLDRTDSTLDFDWNGESYGDRDE